MKRSICMVLLLTALALPTLNAEAAPPKELSSKITTVTVYSDRAQVTREARVDLSRQPSVYSFTKLPGWVDDATVRVSLPSAKAGRIIDVRVQREYLGHSTDEAHMKAQQAVQEISDQIAAIDDELAILNVRNAQIQNIRVFAMEKIPRDTAVKGVNVDDYKKVVDFVSDSLLEVAAERRKLQTKRRELAPELMARQRKLNSLDSLTNLEETTVQVTVQGNSAGRSKLTLTYMLPGATWEPVHELRVIGANPGSAEMSSFAVVAQTSGEDWTDAELRFSTQSSTATVRIPQLEALKLGSSAAAAKVAQEQQKSFDRAQEAFQQQNRMWNEVNAPLGNQMEVYDDNFQRLQVAQGRAYQTFQRLQSRGTSAHFIGEGTATIRSDGHTVRIPIGKTTLNASQNIIAVPEQSLNAVRTLEMLNQGTQPLLPGTVALFHEGAFLGNTDIDFIAEGEPFQVFLGVADQVKLSRVLDRKHSEVNRKKTTRMKVTWIVTVENLSNAPVTLDLADRIPVSENEKIEIDDIEVSGDKDPDSKGLLKWHLTLKPHEKKIFKVQYRIEYPTALVQQMRARKSMRKQKSNSAMPASRSESYDFEEQIINLDSAL